LIVPTATPRSRGATHAALQRTSATAGRGIVSTSQFRARRDQAGDDKRIDHVLFAKLDWIHSDLVGKFI
jgi:hypothetical protein